MNKIITAYKALYRDGDKLWSYTKSDPIDLFGIQYSEVDWTVAPFGGLFVVKDEVALRKYTHDYFGYRYPAIEGWKVAVDTLISITHCSRVTNSPDTYKEFWAGNMKYTTTAMPGTYICNKLRLLERVQR